jgi:hypothetical protein
MSHVKIVIRDIGTYSAANVHARLLIERSGEWVLCGVFQLLQSEWDSLAQWCRAHAVEIVYEAAPIPADVAATL